MAFSTPWYDMCILCKIFVLLWWGSISFHFLAGVTLLLWASLSLNDQYCRRGARMSFGLSGHSYKYLFPPGWYVRIVSGLVICALWKCLIYLKNEIKAELDNSLKWLSSGKLMNQQTRTVDSHITEKAVVNCDYIWTQQSN